MSRKIAFNDQRSVPSERIAGIADIAKTISAIFGSVPYMLSEISDAIARKKSLHKHDESISRSWENPLEFLIRLNSSDFICVIRKLPDAMLKPSKVADMVETLTKTLPSPRYTKL